MFCSDGFRHQFSVQTRFSTDSDEISQVQSSSVDDSENKVHKGLISFDGNSGV